MRRITLGILTYNRLKYLKKMIESIEKQTFKDFDVIVFDNASTDGTQDYLDSKIDYRVIRQEKNINMIGHMNFALNHMKYNINTDYFALLHDDDELTADFLEEGIKILDQGYTIMSFNPIFIDDQSFILYSKQYKNSRIISENEYLKYFLCNRHGLEVCCPSVLYNRDFIKRIDLKAKEEVGPAFDQVLWIDINEKGGTIFLSKKNCFKYRLHDNQGSCRNYNMINELSNYLVKNHLKCKKQINNYNCAKAVSFYKYNLKRYIINEINKDECKNEFKKIKLINFQFKHFTYFTFSILLEIKPIHYFLKYFFKDI